VTFGFCFVMKCQLYKYSVHVNALHVPFSLKFKLHVCHQSEVIFRVPVVPADVMKGGVISDSCIPYVLSFEDTQAYTLTGTGCTD
jgi:hypothetical protein